MHKPTRKTLYAFSILFMYVVIAAQGSGEQGSDAHGRVIVFVQSDVSEVARSFERSYLPEIARIARELGSELEIREVTDGAPAEVTGTPTIVFQNHRGRSFYYGRYTTLDRLRSFIRTSRIAPQAQQITVREDVPVLTIGRAKVALRIKIAPVTGTRPPEYDDQLFHKEAESWIVNALQSAQLRERAQLQRTDRTYYLDFNPWRSEDGTLFLSVELYSQYHCKRPVYRKTDPPWTGPWDQRARLFRQAAKQLEKQVLASLADTEIGDGLDAISTTVALRDWTTLGLALPPPPDGNSQVVRGGELTRDWSLLHPLEHAESFLMFQFPPPLDGYAGEVRFVSGQWQLADGMFLDGSTGWIKADPKTVTMGEPDLDKALQGSTFLHTEQFADSRFELKEVSSDGQPISPGVTTSAELRGVLTMKGVTIPLTFNAEFTPAHDKNGNGQLVMAGKFTIPLEPFDLEGPDPTQDASKQLDFRFRFTFTPTSG